MAEAALKISPSHSIDDVVAVGKAVGDRLRAGILHVLHEESYSVSELCEIFEVPQPALSHHLKILHRVGLVARRREGNSIFYRRAGLAGDALANVLLDTLDQIELPGEIPARTQTVHRNRRQRSEDFFTQHAGEITSHQAEICEPAVYTDTVVDILSLFLDSGVLNSEVLEGDALEVGPGDGRLLSWLAGRFESATGIDSSAQMLEAARRLTGNLKNVVLEHGNFLTLSTSHRNSKRYAAVVAAMVVHHMPSPASFFLKARELLNDSGALVIAELCRHDQEWAGTACGDQWLGFEPEELTNWAQRAGFSCRESQYLAQKNGFRIQIHLFQADSSPDYS